jgi:hypothetical protein
MHADTAALAYFSRRGQIGTCMLHPRLPSLRTLEPKWPAQLLGYRDAIERRPNPNVQR